MSKEFARAFSNLISVCFLALAALQANKALDPDGTLSTALEKAIKQAQSEFKRSK